MAYIKKSGEHSYRVEIRRKGVELYASFRDQKTAELWAAYKEDLIDQITMFDVPMSNMITLEDAIDLKIKELMDSNKDQRTVADVKYLKNYFVEFLDKTLDTITYEILLEKSQKMASECGKIGGNPDNQNTGRKVILSPKTIIKKFRVLSSVFSHVIDKGLFIENPALKVCSFIHKNVNT